MKKLLLFLAVFTIILGSANEARAGLNLHISLNAPSGYYRPAPCYGDYYNYRRPVVRYYSAPVYYKRHHRGYYSEPVYYRSSSRYSRHHRGYR